MANVFDAGPSLRKYWLQSHIFSAVPSSLARIWFVPLAGHAVCRMDSYGQLIHISPYLTTQLCLEHHHFIVTNLVLTINDIIA